MSDGSGGGGDGQGQRGNVNRFVSNMPLPGAKDAPHFNGVAPTDFLKRIEILAKNAALSDENDKVDFIYQYSSDRIKEQIRFIPTLDIDETTKTWIPAKDMFLAMYGVADIKKRVTEQTLSDYCTNHAMASHFSHEQDVADYSVHFNSISAPLLKNEDITDKTARVKFMQGIPKDLQQWVLDKLPEANRTVETPPLVIDVYKILLKRFDTQSPYYAVNTKSDPMFTDSFDARGNRIFKNTNTSTQAASTSHHDSDSVSTALQPVSSVIHPSIPVSQKPVVAAPPSEMDILTKAFEEMKINQAKLIADAVQNALRAILPSQPISSPAMNTVAQNTDGPSQIYNRPPGPRECRMCNETIGPDHPYGMQRCKHTLELLESGDVIMGVGPNGRPRVLMADGSELPYVPPGIKGGAAEIIRARKATKEERTASTRAVRFGIGNRNMVFDEFFAAYPITSDISSSDPVLRSEKETSKRNNPIRKPEDKGKGKIKDDSPSQQVPSTSQPPAQPQSTPTPSTSNPEPQPVESKKDINIPPPTNPINKPEGWRESLPKNSKNQDVEMKDETKRSQNPYRVTSDIQERTNIADITESVLDTKLTVSLKDLIGSSPALQKSFDELFRSKRIYNSPAKPKSNAYISACSEPKVWIEADTSPSNYAGRYSNTDLHFGESESSEIDRFLVSYATRAISVPTRKFMAMTCGHLKIEVNGKTLKALVDTGSELNIAGSHFAEVTGCPIDFKGTDWFLKGIHGQPERLMGLCPDAPVTIGGYEFPTHIFVSRFDIGPMDLILGQPFFQWYAARIDYNRSGRVFFLLWQSGERTDEPTVGVTIADPGNERNTSNLRPTLPAQYLDNEDFY